MPKFEGEGEQSKGSHQPVTLDQRIKRPCCDSQGYKERNTFKYSWDGGRGEEEGEGEVEDRRMWEGGLQRQWKDSTGKGTSVFEAGGRRGQMM